MTASNNVSLAGLLRQPTHKWNASIGRKLQVFTLFVCINTQATHDFRTPEIRWRSCFQKYAHEIFAFSRQQECPDGWVAQEPERVLLMRQKCSKTTQIIVDKSRGPMYDLQG